MRPHRDVAPGLMRVRALGHAALVGGAGAAWGLGLSRFLAEAVLWWPLYSSRLAVGAVALGCGLIAAAFWRWSFILFPSRAEVGSLASVTPLVLPLFYGIGVVSHPLAGGLLLLVGALLALLLAWEDRPTWLLSVLLALGASGLYVRTLLPSVGEADTMEFQVVAARLGIAHPTGYPLYILLTKLFTLLPLNNVAWRVNLASAVFATGAVVLVYDIVRRLTDRPLFSWLTALAFASSTTFWSQAVVAEVYTLHNLFVAALFWLLLRCPGPGGEGELRQARRWQMTLLLVGLSLTNHLTTLLLIPAVVLALLWERPRVSFRQWLVGGGLFLLGLSVYLFIPLRWPALNDGRRMTVREFFTYVSGGQFHGALRLDGWQDPTRWDIVVRLLREPFGWAGLCLGGLGVVNLAIHRRRALALTGVTFVAFVLYGLSYYVADIAVFLLPAHLILAIWVGLGAAFLAWLLGSSSSLSSGVWRTGLVAVFALLPLSRVWMNFSAVDRSRDQGGYAWAQYVLDQPLARDSAVLADTKKFAPLYYLQQVEGVRPDLDIVILGTEELYQADLRRRLGRGQTVYLARYLPHLEEFHLRSVGPLAEVSPRPPQDDPASDDGVARFGEGIELLDADLHRDRLGRQIIHVTLQWRAEEPLGSDFLVRLRLVDADGQVAWKSEGSRPVNGLYPTNAWAVDVSICDYHGISIPPWLPSGVYRLEVGLFPPFGDNDEMGDGGAASWLPLEAVGVEPPSDPHPLPHEGLYAFGDGTWLTGFDLPREASADSQAVLDLSWRGVEQQEEIRISWVDAEGRRGGAATYPVHSGMLRSRHAVATPDAPGTYTLELGMIDKPARCGWLASPTEACPLDEVEMVAAMVGLANFADRILLLEADVGRREARPTDLVPVTLRWRGLRSIDEDYTVFVHLVGPDGRLYGQDDTWPVQGSYPTSQWVPGREILDRHEVQLEPDAPRGVYRVEVGWYLLETMRRLQLLDERGQPVADAFVVDTISVRE
ncbi:MAG: DUF2723 domain-containing protein [Chloroflexota bacterium]|nr:DUF2723 domain-containing protein [Chloroflexota bacterium]